MQRIQLRRDSPIWAWQNDGRLAMAVGMLDYHSTIRTLKILDLFPRPAIYPKIYVNKNNFHFVMFIC